MLADFRRSRDGRLTLGQRDSCGWRLGVLFFSVCSLTGGPGFIVGCWGPPEIGPESAIRALEATIGPTGSGNKAGIVDDLSARKKLGTYPVEDVIRAAAFVFNRAKVPEDKARALASLLMLDSQRARNPEYTGKQAAMLAQSGLADANPRVAFFGAQALEAWSHGDQDDRQAVARRLGDADESFLAESLYALLCKWGDRRAILARVYEPWPARSEGDASDRWALHVSFAIRACCRPDWRAQGVAPAELAPYLVQLMEKEPRLTAPATDCLIELDARQVVPQMETLLGKLPPGATRALVGITMLTLGSGVPRPPKLVTQLLDEALREYQRSPDRLPTVRLLVRRFGVLGGKEQDKELPRLVWEECKVLTQEDRADLLWELMSGLASTDNSVSWAMDWISDAQLSQLLAVSPTLRMRLRTLTWRATQAGSEPAPEKPERLALRDRIRRLTDQVEAKGGKKQ